MDRELNLIITGTTGMVGEGVLLTCLDHPGVRQVLVINRRSCGITHPKLKEILHENFLEPLSPQVDFRSYHGCFFCIGVTSIGKNEERYRKLTYDLTLHFAQQLASQNQEMVFCYVSGSGTDSSEKGKLMWARVKGKTENDLIKLFPNAYMIRPGFMRFIPGQKNVPKAYMAMGTLYPFFHFLFPRHASTVKEIGLAMINAVQYGYEKQVLEVKDVVKLAAV